VDAQGTSTTERAGNGLQQFSWARAEVVGISPRADFPSAGIPV